MQMHDAWWYLLKFDNFPVVCDLDEFCLEVGFAPDELVYHANDSKRTLIPYEDCIDYYEGSFDILMVVDNWYDGEDLHVVVSDW